MFGRGLEYEVTQEEVCRAVLEAQRAGVEPPYDIVLRVPGSRVPDGVMEYSRKFGVRSFVGEGLVGPYCQWRADASRN